jgi:membrane protease YdiL (CAAX protease family)
MSMPTAASIQALISFLLGAFALYRMVRISPNSRARLQWRPLGRKWIPIGFLLLYLVGLRLFFVPFGHVTFDKVLDVTIFVAGVGLVEESIFRGWLFVKLERISERTALIVSSFIFGLLHLINLLSDLQFRAVIGQASAAMSMGFLFASVMLYTGTIWVPIFLHALMDLPFFLMDYFDQLQSGSYGQVLTGVVVIFGVNMIIGLLFLKAAQAPQLEPSSTSEADSD